MFNLLFIVTKEDSEKVRNLLTFATEKEAVSRLYSEFAYATAGSSGIAKIVGEIIDDDGHVMRCDRYGSEPVRLIEVNPESVENKSEE